MTAPGQVMGLWRRNRYSIRPIFQGNRVFIRVTCCHWLERGYYAWLRIDDQFRPSTLHLDLSKVIQGHWPWLTTCPPIVTISAVLGIFWCPENEYVADFSLTQFAPKRICRWEWCYSLPGCYMSQIFDQETVTTLILSWTRNTLKKVLYRNDL